MANTQLSTALTDAILFTGETFVEKQSLLIQDGKVLDIVPNSHIPDGFERTALPDSILAPGFIDCQANGGDNILFNNAPDAASMVRAAKAHEKTGTTGFLPTIITDRPDVSQAALAALPDAMRQNSAILGLHLEGPHISLESKRAHDERFIRPMTEDDVAFYKAPKDSVLLLTIAPEQVTLDQVKALRAQGTILSIGHTAAKADLIHDCIKAGVTGFTHLFTAMSPMKSREPGPVGIALTEDTAWCGFIGDGQHVAKELFEIALRCKPEDKLFLVSDSAAQAGAEKPEQVRIYGTTFNPNGRVCTDEKGLINGSLMTLGNNVAIAIKELGQDPQRVLRMASAIPAAFLGLDKKLGKLLPGYDANIVALDHSFRATQVWRDGKNHT